MFLFLKKAVTLWKIAETDVDKDVNFHRLTTIVNWLTYLRFTGNKII